MKYKLLFNPFSKIGERPLLMTGILATVAGSLAGGSLDIGYDGWMDVHAHESSFLQSFLENLINIVTVAALLSVAAYMSNRRTRIIDILNAVMIARVPTYLAAVISSNPVLDDFANRIVKNPQDINQIYGDSMELTIVLIISCVLLLLFIWSIALLVFGYRVASNARKLLPWVYFVAALITAEALSKFLIYSIYQ